MGEGRGQGRRGGDRIDAHGSARSSSVNDSPLGPASVHSPLFVRFECAHEASDDEGEVEGGPHSSGGGVGGIPVASECVGSQQPRARPRKGTVVDTRHNLSRALKANPPRESIPWFDEPTDEERPSNDCGSSLTGPQSYLCMFATTLPTANWSSAVFEEARCNLCGGVEGCEVAASGARGGADLGTGCVVSSAMPSAGFSTIKVKPVQSRQASAFSSFFGLDLVHYGGISCSYAFYFSSCLWVRFYNSDNVFLDKILYTS